MREQKSSIRKVLRERKDAMDPVDRLEKSRAICRHLMTLITDHETVMAYTSKEKEVNTVPIITRLLLRKNPVIVPIIVKEDVSLRLSYLRDFAALVPSTFGVPEPIGSEIPARGGGSGTVPGTMTGSWKSTPSSARSVLRLPARRWAPFRWTGRMSAWIILSPRTVSYIRKG